MTRVRSLPSPLSFDERHRHGLISVAIHRLRTLGMVVVACVLSACGDDIDREAACKDEKRLTEDIYSKATDVDGISAQGLCTLSRGEIAQRLGASAVWGTATDAERDARAQQYVTNCEKAAKAKADCGG
jgi:hypothetical protein